MFDFVPLNWYTPIFDWLIFWLVLRAAFQGFNGQLFDAKAAAWKDTWAALFALLLIVYMGLRPINIVFGDTVNYYSDFIKLKDNLQFYQITYQGEWVFNGLMMLFAKYSDIHYFFLLCAMVYVGGLWWAVKRFFGNNYYLPFLVVLSMFTFWAYGVNGVRNGMAAALVILALSMRGKWVWQAVLCLLAIGIHKSLLVVIVGAILAFKIVNTRLYLIAWLFCIVLSAIAGETISNYLLNSGLIEDNRFANYLTSNQYSDQFSSTGFRWDFLLYSSLPVAIGVYFIYFKEYKDQIYIWLFNIYLFANAFWVIIIRAEFANRFAQLSWFIMPLVLIYPYCMKEFWPNQSQKTAWALLLFYAYTFVYNIVLH
jgi:hypothetical protein